MELRDVIRQRHSIRNFSDKNLSLDILHELIKFANLAPSAGNLQAREFIIVNNDEIREKLSIAALEQKFIFEAPVSIVVCANLNRISSYGERGRELYCIQDAAATAEHLLLLAMDKGLGACWIGAFYENEVSKILNLPSYVRPVAIIPIGYPKGKIDITSRMDPKHLTHYNGW